MAKVFIICPVRHVSEEVEEKIRGYIAQLEEAGHKVHWPKRDTDQDDPNGIRICMDNCDALIEVDEVHIWFDPASTGSHFDRGMLFALLRLGFRKRVVLINDVRPTPDRKSFENVFITLAGGRDIARKDAADILSALVGERKDLEGTVL